MRTEPLNYPKQLRNESAELLPVSWEQPSTTGLPTHHSASWVRVFRYESNGTRYDLQFTKRFFTPERFDDKDPKQASAFTLTIWGWYHNDGTMSAGSVGRTFRWKDHDHINGQHFANVMALNVADANALLELLQDCQHSASTIVEVTT